MKSLLKKVLIQGKIKALTGLHIGGTNNALSIGGPDNMIIRNPLNNRPYIPGSSLKGKMRSLIEIRDGTIKNVNMGKVNHGPTDDPEARAAQLFGTTHKDHQQPSRLVVRDGDLSSDEALFNNTDLPYTESKTEVVIDRITSAAMPRQLERVPAGAEFSLDMVLNIFSGEDEKKLRDTLFEALHLLSDDYLGGSGSRGSGKVAFLIEKVEERDMEYYRTGSGSNDLTDTCRDQIEILRAYYNELTTE